MNQHSGLSSNQPLYSGYLYAITATLIWSGNFVVARNIAGTVPPITLAFFRWFTASLIIVPVAWSAWRREQAVHTKHWRYLFWTALLGVSLYNTFIYKAGQQVPAIELALITTTSSPVFSLFMAALILKEKIHWIQVLGLVICISGILLLIFGGSWDRLLQWELSSGTGWLILAAFLFAAYNILVRKKPEGISSLPFLMSLFVIGTIGLVPGLIWEMQVLPPVAWNGRILGIFLYLGLGNSVLAYLCWNASIKRLGAGKTALFGNLIPVFSSIEAVLFLGERFSQLHLLGSVVVIGGLTIANIRSK